MKSNLNPSFSAFEIKNGLLYDNSHNEYPTKLYAFDTESTLDLDDKDSTKYIYVFSDTALLVTDNGVFELKQGMYGSITGTLSISSASGIVIEKLNYKGLFNIGGPIEEKGRLKYIDGCTDTLLIPPPKLGEPCLNLLHFPKDIDQTQHTHPSMRVGMVAKGSGLCKTPWGDIELEKGMLFIIHEETKDSIKMFSDRTGKEELVGLHSFQTFGEPMQVIAYHPDSDFGPSDENHPMINRTIVDGVSAAKIEEIRTK